MIYTTCIMAFATFSYSRPRPLAVLIGVGLPEVPESVATAAGEIRLVGLTPLRPEELQRILDGGREARSAIAGRLAALPPAVLTDPERPAV